RLVNEVGLRSQVRLPQNLVELAGQPRILIAGIPPRAGLQVEELQYLSRVEPVPIVLECRRGHPALLPVGTQGELVERDVEAGGLDDLLPGLGHVQHPGGDPRSAELDVDAVGVTRLSKKALGLLDVEL